MNETAVSVTTMVEATIDGATGRHPPSRVAAMEGGQGVC